MKLELESGRSTETKETGCNLQVEAARFYSTFKGYLVQFTEFNISILKQFKSKVLSKIATGH